MVKQEIKVLGDDVWAVNSLLMDKVIGMFESYLASQSQSPKIIVLLIDRPEFRNI